MWGVAAQTSGIVIDGATRHNSQACMYAVQLATLAYSAVPALHSAVCDRAPLVSEIRRDSLDSGDSLKIQFTKKYSEIHRDIHVSKFSHFTHQITMFTLYSHTDGDYSNYSSDYINCTRSTLIQLNSAKLHKLSINVGVHTTHRHKVGRADLRPSSRVPIEQPRLGRRAG
jgi:hypothetical protein